MKFLININQTNQIDFVCKSAIEAVLFQCSSFSRCGQITDDQLEASIQKIKSAGKEIILDWSILIKDNDLEIQKAQFQNLASLFDAVRFLDPGIGVFLQQNFPKTALHFSTEFGNFNREGLNGWIQFFKPQLSRVILSNQLPVSEIKTFNLDIPIEMMGCGRLEVFYSPRKLVQQHIDESTIPISINCASEDRPTQISPLLENQHGTLMFYDKDLFILDELTDQADEIINFARLELYHLSQYESVCQHFPKEGWINNLKERLSSKTTRGFYRINKSHAPLQRLSNQHLKKSVEGKIGVILESVKKQHMVVEILKPTTLPADFLFTSPEGKKIEYRFQKVEDLKGVMHEARVTPGIYKLPWIKHVVAASVLSLV